jgi:hypothetical protein
MTDTSGQKCLEQLKRLNQVGSWAKMFMGLLIGQEGWYSTKCNLTWKLRGTKYSRFYCQLRPLTHHIAEIEFGLWPTPQATERHRTDVAQQLRKEGKPLYYRRTKDGKARQFSPLDYAVWSGMLPTPTRSDFTHGTAKRIEGYNRDCDLKHYMAYRVGKPSQLSPQFVLEMMGFPTDWTLLPFLNGETNQSKPEATQ